MRETVNITRYNDDGEDYEVSVEVDFEIEPTEYEGPYLFVQGGIYINEAFIDGESVELQPSEENDIISKLKGEYETPVHHYRLDY